MQHSSFFVNQQREVQTMPIAEQQNDYDTNDEKPSDSWDSPFGLLKEFQQDRREFQFRYLEKLRVLLVEYESVFSVQHFSYYWGMLLDLGIFTIDDYCVAYRADKTAVHQWRNPSRMQDIDGPAPSDLVQLQILRNGIELAEWLMAGNKLD